MIPVLYPPNTTDFSTFGRGVLTDTVSCEVTEERNGVFECLLKYPVSGQHYGLITKECIVKAKPNDTAADQAFRIYRITKPLPQLIQRTEDGRKSPALVRRQQSGNIFKQQKRWSFNGGNSGDLKKESASCVILESSAEPCDTEGLTGKTAANKVDIRQGVWVNGSCVCKIYFSFRGVHGVIRLLCVFVYLAVADALKAAEPFKPGAKAADARKHIQKSNWHRSSDRCLFAFSVSPHIPITGP